MIHWRDEDIEALQAQLQAYWSSFQDEATFAGLLRVLRAHPPPRVTEAVDRVFREQETHRRPTPKELLRVLGQLADPTERGGTRKQQLQRALAELAESGVVHFWGATSRRWRVTTTALWDTVSRQAVPYGDMNERQLEDALRRANESLGGSEEGPAGRA